MFEGSRRLFELADSIDEIKSTCSCGRKTIINARIDSQGNIVTDGDQVEIGGDDKYVALCRSCWRNRRIESASRNRLRFARRHFSFLQALSVALVFAPLSAIYYGWAALKNRRPAIALAYLRGTLAGIFATSASPHENH